MSFDCNRARVRFGLAAALGVLVLAVTPAAAASAVATVTGTDLTVTGVGGGTTVVVHCVRSVVQVSDGNGTTYPTTRPLACAQTTTITVSAAEGDNTLDTSSVTPEGGFTSPTLNISLESGNGNDTYRVSLQTNGAHQTTVKGGDGRNALIVLGSPADDTVTLAGGQLVAGAESDQQHPTLSYSGIENLTVDLGGGADEYRVLFDGKLPPAVNLNDSGNDGTVDRLRFPCPADQSVPGQVTANGQTIHYSGIKVTADCSGANAAPPAAALTRTWTVHYRAWNGAKRAAEIVLPAWYGPHDDPPLPLVISPHGRGVNAPDNRRLWGNLPGSGSFALVCPQGQGRQLGLYSWGYRGQIDDLARMPKIVTATLPWVRIDRKRVYGFGGSMGGQETLLLVARYPRLLAGAAAFDSATDMTLRYFDFPRLTGADLQKLARAEIGGTPTSLPAAYAARSPIAYARQIALSEVPLELWWSTADAIVADQAHQSALLASTIEQLNSSAPLQNYIGQWAHSTEMTDSTKLPTALARFGLIPQTAPPLASSTTTNPQPPAAANG